ncbi:hypothetical protein CONPUDRAFT_151750 [Coniophora puteana RWD-64-598 SS2]|uniref:Uncharacterized protein n=1 Tax=Coniophora puteana (strain RWD-64-598) TaxID=741705 RepID=A0A5M3MVS8_CONPW|nr:uncharacterized protein CONPUDRAFT_151750 [Coniophora puteana RWD-64-598 SS2]EIW82691.1 hypothetical protein CONPUDRAFT_151750 [Coniophora puteana RWD-64-598 SS2]
MSVLSPSLSLFLLRSSSPAAIALSLTFAHLLPLLPSYSCSSRLSPLPQASRPQCAADPSSNLAGVIAPGVNVEASPALGLAVQREAIPVTVSASTSAYTYTHSRGCCRRVERAIDTTAMGPSLARARAQAVCQNP